MAYINKNINPKNRKTDDCAIRAVAAAMGVDWYEAYDGLCALARKKASVCNASKTVGAYLLANGFAKLNCQPGQGCSRYTVKELAKELNHPAVARVANHFVAIDGKGNYVDTWDCGDKSVYSAWIKA